MKKGVFIRLSEKEMELLERWPGNSESERARTAITSQSTALLIARETGKAVAQEVAPLLLHFASLQRTVEQQQRQLEQQEKRLVEFTAAAKSASGSATIVADRVTEELKKSESRIQSGVTWLNQFAAQIQQRR